jgi:hypothetical protein
MERLDRALGGLALVIGYLVLGLVVLFLLGSLLPRGGSLDDLDGEAILRAVNKEAQRG